MERPLNINARPVGRFPFTKNFRFEFSEILVSNETGLYSVITWSVFASGFWTPFIVCVQTVRLETFEWNTRIFENTEISTFGNTEKVVLNFRKSFPEKILFHSIPTRYFRKFRRVESARLYKERLPCSFLKRFINCRPYFTPVRAEVTNSF